MKEFQRCIESDAKDVDSMFYKGVCLYGMKRIKEAIEAFDETLAVNARYKEAIEYKAKCDLLLKKIEITSGMRKKIIKEKCDSNDNSTCGSGNEMNEKEEM